MNSSALSHVHSVSRPARASAPSHMQSIWPEVPLVVPFGWIRIACTRTGTARGSLLPRHGVKFSKLTEPQLHKTLMFTSPRQENASTHPPWWQTCRAAAGHANGCSAAAWPARAPAGGPAWGPPPCAARLEGGQDSKVCGTVSTYALPLPATSCLPSHRTHIHDVAPGAGACAKQAHL